MIKLMIDSAADITKEEAEKLGMLFMPIEVRFGDEEFLDGETLKPVEFYEKLAVCKELPKTSQINPFRFEEKFEKVVNAGDELVVISLSSKLSGTYANAKNVAEKFGGKVRVIDSLSAASGEKILGLYALELINQGKSLDEIEQKLNEKKQKIKIFALLDTLKYLKMGGRISPLVAFAGGVISLKPVVGVVEGEVRLVAKAIGTKKGFVSVCNLIKQSGEIDFAMPMSYIYSGSDKTILENFKKDADILFDREDMSVNILGSTIGTHIGSGAVGVAYFVK